MDGFGISGTAAPQTSVRASTARTDAARAGGQKRTSSGGLADAQAPEIPVGSGLLDRGYTELQLENICRLQYARWQDVDEYISVVGTAPDLWPNGLIKSTKKKGDDCKFYWKKVPEWQHMWAKAAKS